MPVPKSKRQFRFLQAVAHGSAKKDTSLTTEEAKAGLSELHGSAKDLPEKVKSRFKKAKGKKKEKK